MTVSEGSIIKIEGNKARVRIKADEGCGNCPSRDKCKTTGHLETEVLVPPYLNVAVNDRVLVDFNDSPVAAAALLVYILPLICLIIGAAIGNRLDTFYGTQSPVYALVLAVVCFAAPLALFKLFKRRLKSCGKYNAQLLQVLDYNDETYACRTP